MNTGKNPAQMNFFQWLFLAALKHRRILVGVLLFCFQLASINSFAQFTKLLDLGGNGSAPTGGYYNDGTFLYGTTASGGNGSFGTLYKVLPNGTGYQKLIDFDGTNGSHPNGPVTSDGTFLYGTTSSGGANGYGTLYKIMPDGTDYQQLLDLDGTTNGSSPLGTLYFDGSFLYCLANAGGLNDGGTLFKIKTDGTGYQNLHDFGGAADGLWPYGSVVGDGTFLYGMTSDGGANGLGTIFKIKPDGAGYQKMLDFNGPEKGSYPYGYLMLQGTFLYGTTNYGGTNDMGTLFKINKSDNAYTKLLDFDGIGKGNYPGNTLFSDGTFLYGATEWGGVNDNGVLYKIKLDGTGFVKLIDFDEPSTGSVPNCTMISDGTFLYGMTSSGGHEGQGTNFKIKTDGSGYQLFFEHYITGNYPTGSLISDGTFLYGMTEYGGGNDIGTIFKVLPDGTGYRTVWDFSNGDPTYAGVNPKGSLFFDGTFLYGMTSAGGFFGQGTIFKIKPDGTGYLQLYDFDTPNGSTPYGSLISDGSVLYGMTSAGGLGQGVVFKIGFNGTGFQKLVEFNGVNGGAPHGSLLLIGNVLYGTTAEGTTSEVGNIFKINKDGSGFISLHDFNASGEGASPFGSLITDGIFLYGMTNNGGSNEIGTVFKIKPDGTGFTTLHSFASPGNTSLEIFGDLTYDGTNLYGMTKSGGNFSVGNIFTIKPDGTSFAELFSFQDDVENGSNPQGSLLRIGTTFYGVTQNGGTSGIGTVFKASVNFGSITVTQHPADVGLCLGQTATLVTAASGVLGISYKWQKFNGTSFVDIDDQEADGEIVYDGYEGTDSPVLKVTPVNFPSMADFRCRIFSAFAAEVFSGTATVSVVAGLVSKPEVVANSGCGPGQYLITAFGATDGNYQWYNNGVLVSGEVNSTFTTPFISAPTVFSVANKIGSCVSDQTLVEVNTLDCAPSPGLVWVAQPQTTGSSQIKKLAIDAAGNIYAVGRFTGTVDFDTGSGTAILSTAVADVPENFLLKLTRDRNVVWVKSLNNVYPDIHISLDGIGAIYLSGGFTGTVDFDPGTPVFNMTATGSTDTHITKLDTDGNFIWTRRMGGSGTNQVIAASVSSDANGVYITGGFRGTVDFDPNAITQTLLSSLGSTFFSDIFISKLTASGNYAWAFRMGRSSAQDGGRAIKVDASGNLYTVGTFSGTVDFDPGTGIANLVGLGATDFYIHKMSNAGSFIWAKTITSLGVEQPTALALDAAGNPHITGTFGTSSLGATVDFDPGTGISELTAGPEVFILKLNTSGNFVWAKNIGATFSTESGDITVDASGNVLVVGSSEGIDSYSPDYDPGPAVYPLRSTQRNIFVTQLNSAGNFSWAYNIKSDGYVISALNSLSIVSDPDGSIYTNGRFSRMADLDPGHCVYSLFANDGESFIQKIKPGVAALCFNLHPISAVNCSGSSSTFSVEATGTSNITYQWQKFNTATSLFENITNTAGYSGTTTSTLVVNTSGNFGAGTYLCKASGDNAPDKNSNVATLSLNAIPPTVTDSESCSPGAQTLHASGTIDGNYRWYNVASGGTAIAGETASNFTTPALTTTSVFYVSIVSGLCESTRTAVTATISPVPAAPTTTGASNCGPGSVTLSASGGTNGQYLWYDVMTAGTPLPGAVNSTFITAPLAATTSYYVSIDNGCESTRTVVTATISTPPPSPTITAASRCGPGTVTLSASGGSNGQYLWYTVATGGTAIAGETNSVYVTPTLSSTTSYYVSIMNGCEGTRTAVTATINPTPGAPATTGASGCLSAALTLVATGGTNGQYRWYTAATGGIPITGEVNNTYTTSALTASTTYFVSIHNGTCESVRSSVIATIQSCGTNQPPVIAPINVEAHVDGKVSVSLLGLLSDPDNNLDLSTLKIIVQPSSGARASIDAQRNLILDYTGISFSGIEKLTIEVCDVLGACAQKELTIEVAGDIIVYNGVSPNGDGQNEIFFIQYIDILEETKKNRVSVYNRWGDLIFDAVDYDNKNKVFRGFNNNGGEVPSGTYFYKIEFNSGKETKMGYFSLKR